MSPGHKRYLWNNSSSTLRRMTQFSAYYSPHQLPSRPSLKWPDLMLVQFKFWNWPTRVVWHIIWRVLTRQVLFWKRFQWCYVMEFLWTKNASTGYVCCQRGRICLVKPYHTLCSMRSWPWDEVKFHVDFWRSPCIWFERAQQGKCDVVKIVTPSLRDHDY